MCVCACVSEEEWLTVRAYCARGAHKSRVNNLEVDGAALLKWLRGIPLGGVRSERIFIDQEAKELFSAPSEDARSLSHPGRSRAGIRRRGERLSHSI